jgi:hypothetical protein
MTEQNFQSPGNNPELTNQTPNPRLNREGDFMVDSSQEQPPGAGGDAGNNNEETQGRTQEDAFREHVRQQARRREAGQEQGDEDDFGGMGGEKEQGKNQQYVAWVRQVAAEARASVTGNDAAAIKKRDAAVNKAIIEKILRRENPYGEYLSKGLVEAIVELEADRALDYLLTKLTMVPMDAETTGYERGFYGPMSHSTLKEVLKSFAHQIREEAHAPDISSEEQGRLLRRATFLESQAKRYEFVYTGSSLVHNLNMAIMTGQVKGFVEQSQSLDSSYIQALLQTKFVPQMMRLYEQEILRVRTRDGQITAKNFSEITGTIFDDKGAVVGAIGGTIEDKLKQINESLPSDERLDDWELKWAYYTGRNLLNITLRTGELLAQGNTSTSRAFPMESAAGLIDKINLSTERFHIGKVRGGIHFVKMIKQYFEEDRRRRGYEDVDIVTMLGRSRKEFEGTGILDVSGMFNGWRMTNSMLIKDPEKYSNELISLETFLAEDRYDSRGETNVFQRTKFNLGNSDDLRRAFYALEKDENGKLIKDEKGNYILKKDASGEYTLKEEFSYSLGTLLKFDKLLPNDKDVANNKDGKGEEILKAKREIRTKIFERIAKENPAGMVLFLRGLRFERESDFGRQFNASLEDLDRFMYGTERITPAMLSGTTPPHLKDTQEWKLLNEKLTLANEIRLRNISKSLAGDDVSKDDMSFEQIFKKVLSDIAPEQAEMCIARYKEISSIGQKISGQLAEIRFPSVPILNDLLYENYKFTEAGTEIARRRLGGDVPKFYEAMEKIAHLIQNIQDIDPKKAMEELHIAVDALAFPLGQESSQSNIYPVVKAYLRYIQAGGEKFQDISTPEQKALGEAEYKYDNPLMVWLKTQGIYKAIKQAANQPTSIAQVYGGKTAYSYNEMELDDLVNDAVKLGTLRRGVKNPDGSWMWTDLYSDVKKKFKIGWFWKWFSVVFRDLWIYYAMGMAKEFGKDTTKGIDKN